MEWTYDDGGRSAYYKASNVGDCVCRAIAIATEKDYKEVYDDLSALHKERYGTKSARNGAHRDDIKELMRKYGWRWTPTMRFGQGCKVHMREDELPSGRLVLSLSKHLTAVVDGVCHDTYDPSRGGTRCVYGYWAAPAKPSRRKKTFREELFDAKESFLGGTLTAEQYADRVDALVAERGWR